MFKNIFNKFKAKNEDEINNKEEFEKSCKKYSQYYYQQEINMDLKHPETHKPMMFADSFPEEFHEWCSIKSSYDKKRLVFSVLDNYFWNSVPLWKLLDRLIEDRRIQDALEIIESNIDEPEEKQIEYYLVLAKLYLILGQYEKSRLYIEKISSKDPDNRNLNLFLIDYYYHINNHKNLHQISDRLLKEFNLNNNIDQTFQNSFSKIKGNLRSIYLLIQFGKSLEGKQDENRFWELAEEEFYWSPTLRKEHAYLLLKKGETLKAFAKLLVLVKEMPWDKEAALNTMEFMEKMSYDNGDKEWLSNLIKENSWSTEGMNSVGEFDIKL